MQKIPKKLHIIWIGDENKCPDSNIKTWTDKHPTWEFKLWGNAELDNIAWRSKRQMDIFRAAGMWEGIADLMRYEILHDHGGFYADADSICVHSLDDWLLDTGLLAVWESELYRPGLIANTFIGSIPSHPALVRILQKTSVMNKAVTTRKLRHLFSLKIIRPWKTVGPRFFTKMILPFCPAQATILPSVLFLSKHYTDKEGRQSSLIYARHEWKTTNGA